MPLSSTFCVRINLQFRNLIFCSNHAMTYFSHINYGDYFDFVPLTTALLFLATISVIKTDVSPIINNRPFGGNDTITTMSLSTPSFKNELESNHVEIYLSIDEGNYDQDRNSSRLVRAIKCGGNYAKCVDYMSRKMDRSYHNGRYRRYKYGKYPPHRHRSKYKRRRRRPRKHRRPPPKPIPVPKPLLIKAAVHNGKIIFPELFIPPNAPVQQYTFHGHATLEPSHPHPPPCSDHHLHNPPHHYYHRTAQQTLMPQMQMFPSHVEIPMFGSNRPVDTFFEFPGDAKETLSYNDDVFYDPTNVRPDMMLPSTFDPETQTIVNSPEPVDEDMMHPKDVIFDQESSSPAFTTFESSQKDFQPLVYEGEFPAASMLHFRGPYPRGKDSSVASSQPYKVKEVQMKQPVRKGKVQDQGRYEYDVGMRESEYLHNHEESESEKGSKYKGDKNDFGNEKFHVVRNATEDGMDNINKAIMRIILPLLPRLVLKRLQQLLTQSQGKEDPLKEMESNKITRVVYILDKAKDLDESPSIKYSITDTQDIAKDERAHFIKINPKDFKEMLSNTFKAELERFDLKKLKQRETKKDESKPSPKHIALQRYIMKLAGLDVSDNYLPKFNQLQRLKLQGEK